jgi:predicted transcriptional regulator
MKLWRKIAKKDPVTGKRNGRQIRYEGFVSEQVLKLQPRTYPLLDALIERAGLKFVMSKKEEAKLAEMIASVSEEKTDETK